MAKEILAVPEERLAEVIAVIRAGLREAVYMPNVSDETVQALTEWCDQEEEYLKGD